MYKAKSITRGLSIILLITIIWMSFCMFDRATVYANSVGYGRQLDHNNLGAGNVGAWIWDRDSDEGEHSRTPIIYYFYPDGTYEYLWWPGPKGYEEFDSSKAVVASSEALYEMTWEGDENGIDMTDYYDGEPEIFFGFWFEDCYDIYGHSIIKTAGQAGDPCEIIPITDAAYYEFKEYTASDWKGFDYHKLENEMPRIKHLKLSFNDESKISFDWGSDLFKNSSINDGSFNPNLAKAAIYLCEGTYHGENEAKLRMKDLGLSNPYSQYFKFTYKAYTSPIILASGTFIRGKQRYMIIAVAVRGTKLEDIDDVLTDINEGVFNDSGFELSGNNGMEVVRDYCNNMRLQNGIDEEHTILFVTGHSLGAAVAGQIAGNLQGEVALQKNIYAYTFASPFYETHGKNVNEFKNIHNIVNVMDAVPKFPIGGKRYGINRSFSGDGKDMLDQHMLGVYLRALEKTSPPKTSIQSLKKGKKSFSITWKKKNGISGYQIQYGQKSNFKGAKTITIKKAGTKSKVVKNLKAKKKYYVRIRTYKTTLGKKFFSAWTSKMVVKTR